MPALGLVETVWCWRVESPELDIDQIKDLSTRIIKLVGMTPDGFVDWTEYPNWQGKGGYGIQVYQKLVESFLVISTWPDHRMLRIYLASCMPFDPDRVSMFLNENIGRVQATGGCTI